MAGLIVEVGSLAPVGVVVTAASALTLGVAYALIGVAVTAVAIATRTLHLAIGSILVAGVLTRVGLEAVGTHPAVAILVALLIGAALSAALEPLVLRPLGPRRTEGGVGTGPVPTGVIVRWLVGFAVVAALLEVAIARWLVVRHVRPRPLIGDADAAVVVAIVVGLGAATVLGVLMVRSGWGRRLRLVGGSPLAAALSGISPGRVRAGALAVSGAAAVLAGLLIAPIIAVGAGQGPGLTLRGVAAAILLGVGGPARAVAAGLLLGAVEAVAQTVAPGLRADVVIAVVVVVALAWRGGELRREWGRPW